MSRRLRRNWISLLSCVSFTPASTLNDCTTDGEVSGFTLYSQALFGQTPCYTVLSTDLSVPGAVSAQISQLKSEIAATASSSAPTVSVNLIENQVFALNLPHTKRSSGLTTGAQIGIGVGSSVAGLGLILLLLLLLFRRRRFLNKQENQPINTTSIQSSREMAFASSLQPTPGHTSPFQDPTPHSGSSSGDPRMFPYNMPWPYQPGSNYSSAVPVRAEYTMVQPSSSMPYDTIPAGFAQPPPMVPHQQGPTFNYLGQQRAEELEGEQTARYEADVSHLQPGGFSVLPGGRVYPHPQEMGRNTPATG